MSAWAAEIYAGFIELQKCVERHRDPHGVPEGFLKVTIREFYASSYGDSHDVRVQIRMGSPRGEAIREFYASSQKGIRRQQGRLACPVVVVAK